MVDIASITNAALAPFAEQVGMQGFAYGLLGLKTVRKIIRFVRSRGRKRSAAEEANPEEEDQ